jgi:hypothetical protein
VIGLWILVASSLAACAGMEAPKAKEKSKFDSGLPGMRTNMSVDAVTDRGPYLEAALSFEKSALWAYTAPSENCRALFQVGTSAKYVDNGPLGQFRRDELECQVLGIGNLELWRDRNRRATAAGIPRAQANFKILHADDEVTLLRGQFPLASSVGFSGGLDLVAVVENTKNCEGPIASGTASMEYRGKGKRAISLVGKSGLCRVRGLIQPLPSAQPRVKAGGEDG